MVTALSSRVNEGEATMLRLDWVDKTLKPCLVERIPSGNRISIASPGQGYQVSVQRPRRECRLVQASQISLVGIQVRSGMIVVSFHHWSPVKRRCCDQRAQVVPSGRPRSLFNRQLQAHN